MGGKVRLEGRNLEVAMKMLADVTALLDRYGVRYWLEGGTLLGVVREQRLLPWDTDVDLSITEHALPALLRSLLWFRLRGYRVRVRRQQSEQGPMRRGCVRMVKIYDRKALFFKGDLNVDIFVKYAAGDRYFWTVGTNPAVLKSVPARFYEELAPWSFQGRPYTVPRDAEGYLTARYGNWREPVKEWNFRSDDKAIVAAR